MVGNDLERLVPIHVILNLLKMSLITMCVMYNILIRCLKNFCNTLRSTWVNKIRTWHLSYTIHKNMYYEVHITNSIVARPNHLKSVPLARYTENNGFWMEFLGSILFVFNGFLATQKRNCSNKIGPKSLLFWYEKTDFWHTKLANLVDPTW